MKGCCSVVGGTEGAASVLPPALQQAVRLAPGRRSAVRLERKSNVPFQGLSHCVARAWGARAAGGRVLPGICRLSPAVTNARPSRSAPPLLRLLQQLRGQHTHGAAADSRGHRVHLGQGDGQVLGGNVVVVGGGCRRVAHKGGCGVAVSTRLLG